MSIALFETLIALLQKAPAAYEYAVNLWEKTQGGGTISVEELRQLGTLNLRGNYETDTEAAAARAAAKSGPA